MTRRWCYPCQAIKSVPKTKKDSIYGIDPSDMCFGCLGPSEEELQRRNKLSDEDINKIANKISEAVVLALGQARGTFGYTCEACGGVFESTIEADEAARDEMERNFGDIDPADRAIVCDDCYLKMFHVKQKGRWRS